MDVDKKRELKGNIALIDQALAPLTNAVKQLEPIAEAESAFVDALKDADSDENIEHREKAEELEEYVAWLSDMLSKLEEFKAFIEQY